MKPTYTPKYFGVLYNNVRIDDSMSFYQKLEKGKLLDKKSEYKHWDGKEFKLGIKDEVVTDMYLFISSYIENDYFGFLGDEIIQLQIYLKALKNDKEKENYINNRYKFLFTKLRKSTATHKYIDNNLEEWEDYIKWNIVQNNWYFAMDYLYSKNELQRIIQRIKHTSFYAEWIDCYVFLKMSKIFEQQLQELEYESEVMPLEPEKTNIPKSIAMLHVSGFFDIKEIAVLKREELYRTIAIIVGKDPGNKDHIRSIRGNISVLNHNSGEDITKYTSYRYIEKFKKQIHK